MKEFGMTERYKEWMRLRLTIHKMRLEFLVNQDRRKLTFIKAKELELAAMENSGENSTFETILPIVEKFMGFKIDGSKVKAKKVFQYIDLMQKASKNGKAD